MGLREHDGDVARLLGQRGHATTLLRLHGPPGQRQLGRAECHAQHARDHELGLVRHRRRRRLSNSRRSDRLQHRLYRVAGWEREPVRPADRTRAGEHPSAAASSRRRWSADRAQRRRGGSIPVQLEYAVHAVAAQSGHRMARRQSTLQVAESRGHVGRERGPHEAARPEEGLSDERPGRSKAALPGRRRLALQHDRFCLGIASVAWHRLGRHGRRKRAGEQGFGCDVHRGRKEHVRAARESHLLDLAHRRLALRRRHCLRRRRRSPGR